MSLVQGTSRIGTSARSSITACGRVRRTVEVVAEVAHQVFISVGRVVHQQAQLFDGRNELVVAFQCGVRFWAIHRPAGFWCMAYLLGLNRVVIARRLDQKIFSVPKN